MGRNSFSRRAAALTVAMTLAICWSSTARAQTIYVEHITDAQQLFRGGLTTYNLQRGQRCRTPGVDHAIAILADLIASLDDFLTRDRPTSGFNQTKGAVDATVKGLMTTLKLYEAELAAKRPCQQPTPMVPVTGGGGGAGPGATVGGGPGPTGNGGAGPVVPPPAPKPTVCLTEEQIAERIKEIDSRISRIEVNLLPPLQDEYTFISTQIDDLDREIEHLESVIKGEEDANPDEAEPPGPAAQLADKKAERDQKEARKTDIREQIRKLGLEDEALEREKASLHPCPPPNGETGSTGFYLGGELVKNWGWVGSTERLAMTDVITNRFSDNADPVGGGFLVGYKFAPWANSVVVSPFASFDFMRSPVNHTFAGGSFLGTTANFMGTLGVKVGPRLSFGPWLYGIAGVSVLNQTLNINFVPVASSKSATVAGGTVGFGVAVQPNFLKAFGLPVSLFAEYQHTWWQDANFNTPAASPLFNYAFRRQDDVVKIGFTVPLFPPTPPVSPMSPGATGPNGPKKYVKALPAK